MSSRQYGNEDEIDAGYEPPRKIERPENTVSSWPRSGPRYGVHEKFKHLSKGEENNEHSVTDSNR